MTFYRLRPEAARHQPAFQAGELYRFIETTYPEGYVFVELNGHRRCIETRNFEKVDDRGSVGS